MRALVQAALGRPAPLHRRASFTGRWSALFTDAGAASPDSERGVRLQPDHGAPERGVRLQPDHGAPERGVRLQPDHGAPERGVRLQPDHGAPERGVRLQPDHGAPERGVRLQPDHGAPERGVRLQPDHGAPERGVRLQPDHGESDLETLAWTLLRRYGVVFRQLLAREPNAVAWRLLTRVYRRLEARGEIRGGRFVTGMSGEQFALPDAVARLREIRRGRPDGHLVTISAADPLNLSGILTAGDRIRAARRNRIVYRDGIALAVMEGDFVRELAPIEPAIAADVSRALGRRALSGGVRL